MAFFAVQEAMPTAVISGVCYLCKCPPRERMDGSRERVLDTHVYVDVVEGLGMHEEPLVFCETCVIEMSSLFGHQTPSQVDGLVSGAQQADERIAVLEQELADAQELNRVFVQKAAAALGPLPTAKVAAPKPKA